MFEQSLILNDSMAKKSGAFAASLSAQILFTGVLVLMPLTYQEVLHTSEAIDSPGPSGSYTSSTGIARPATAAVLSRTAFSQSNTRLYRAENNADHVTATLTGCTRHRTTCTADDGRRRILSSAL